MRLYARNAGSEKKKKKKKNARVGSFLADICGGLSSQGNA